FPAVSHSCFFGSPFASSSASIRLRKGEVMRAVWRAGAVALLVWMIVGGRAEATSIIFNNVSGVNFQSMRSAGSSRVADISVAAPTVITEIGVYNDLASNGDLKFLIFNLDTNALLFQSAPQAFVDDGLSFKLSNIFAPFTLLPGINYGIGAIADVAGGWGINNSSGGNAFTQNGITASDDRNGNVGNFATPTLGLEGSAMIIVELGNDTAATTVPEPGTLLLLGSTAAIVLRRRRPSRD